MQVDRRPEQHMSAFTARLAAEKIPDFGEQVGIPRCPERDACRYGDTRRSGRAMSFTSDARRPVAHLELGNAGVGVGLGAPVGLTRDQAALLSQTERPDGCFDVDHAAIMARSAIHAGFTVVCEPDRMTFSWKNTPASIRTAMITAILGFVIRCSSTSTSSTNGRLNECSYTDGGALLFGGVTIIAGIAGIAAATQRKDDKALMIIISVVCVAVGVVHVLRGTGSIGGACN